ncbi:hypothetical protein ACJX0J_007434 [Zea mays]
MAPEDMGQECTAFEFLWLVKNTHPHHHLKKFGTITTVYGNINILMNTGNLGLLQGQIRKQIQAKTTWKNTLDYLNQQVLISILLILIYVVAYSFSLSQKILYTIFLLHTLDLLFCEGTIKTCYPIKHYASQIFIFAFYIYEYLDSP